MVPTKPAEKNPFIFESGDVRILVTYKGEELVGKVSSHGLASASPVLRKFVYQPWQLEIAVEELDFKEGNGEALLVLLNITHLQFKRVPQELKYYEPLQVAVLCDKYDCAKLMRPWLESWLKYQNVSYLERTGSTTLGKDNWIFIAWVFGKEKLFNKLAETLVRKTKKRTMTEFYSVHRLRRSQIPFRQDF